MDDETRGLYFALFNEIGIIEQLSRTLLEARLPEGLTAAHFAVLNHLMRVGEGPTPLRLARAFQVPKTTMTHTLGGLEKRGLVEMRPNPRDGRSKQVWSTAAGRALRDRSIARMAPELEWFAGVFSEDRARALLPVLAEIRQLLDAQRDARADRADGTVGGRGSAGAGERIVWHRCESQR